MSPAIAGRPDLLSLPPELLADVARRVAAGPGLAQLLEFGLAHRVLLATAVPALCREINVVKKDVRLLRSLARAYATPGLFESVRSLRVVAVGQSEAEKREAGQCVARLMRKCSGLVDLTFGVRAAFDWALLRESKLTSLDISVDDSKILRGLSGKSRLPPTLKKLEVSCFFEPNPPFSLNPLWELVERHAEQLDELIFEPFQPGTFDLAPFPRLVSKLSVLRTYSDNQSLLSDLAHLPQFRPHTLKLCDVDHATWDALARMPSLRHLCILDDGTHYFAWGLPPNLKSLEFIRARPGLSEVDFDAARLAARGLDMCFVVTEDDEGNRQGDRLFLSLEWDMLWEDMDNVAAELWPKRYIGISSRRGDLIGNQVG